MYDYERIIEDKIPCFFTDRYKCFLNFSEDCVMGFLSCVLTGYEFYICSYDDCNYAFCYPVMTEHREKYKLKEKEKRWRHCK